MVMEPLEQLWVYTGLIHHRSSWRHARVHN